MLPVTRRTDLYLGAAVVAVFIAVALIASLEKALAAGAICGVLGAIIQTRWESRHDRRFQALIAFFALAHALAISLIPFPEPRYGLVVLPFMMVDAFAIWGILNWIDKRFPRPKNKAAD